MGVDDARCFARLRVHVSAACHQLVRTGVHAEHDAGWRDDAGDEALALTYLRCRALHGASCQATTRRETWAGAQRSRPAGVGWPRASIGSTTWEWLMAERESAYL